MGLMSIADWVNRNGYKSRIIHLGIEWIKDTNFSLHKYLLEKRPQVIAISLHWDIQSYDVISLVQKTKALLPEAITILGGFTASFFDVEIMKNFAQVDAIIRGDGEKPLLSFLNNMNSGDYSSVPNLTWRQNGRIIRNKISYVATKEDLDNFNFTNFSLMENYNLYIKYATPSAWSWFKDLPRSVNIGRIYKRPAAFPLPLGRGCVADCSHCGGGSTAQRLISGRNGFTPRAIDKIAESIKEVKSYGYENIFVYVYPELVRGENKFLISLFREIKNRGIDIGCFMECPDLPNENLIIAFKETFGKSKYSAVRIFANCYSEYVRRLNKGYNYSNKGLLRMLDFINKKNISTELYFLLGLPYDNVKNMRDAYKFQRFLKKKFKSISKIYNFPLLMQPGSLVYLYSPKFGIFNRLRSFSDFYKFHHKETPKRFFFKVGYSMPHFFNGLDTVQSGIKNNRDDKLFEIKLHKLRCRYFCNLIYYFPFLKCGTQRLICNFIGFLWSLKKHILKKK
jgi:radical SAM superfamily enzyme YgiQ (UPF0313 family)